MRLIDVDALKKELRMADRCEDCERNARDCRYVYGFTRMDICSMLDDAPTVGGWISVQDRLPMLIESVLFTGKNAHGGSFLTQRGYFDGTFWHSDSNGTVYANTPVTHWMPLPEPPEEVGEDD